MEKLLKNICAYFEYLYSECHLNCSVHFSLESHARISARMLSSLSAYANHTHPYCNFVKSCGYHPICVKNQRVIHAALEGKDFLCHTCHGGVHELIYPLRCEAKQVYGYVAASGYREETCSEGVRIYNDALYSTLRPSEPPRALTDTLIPPLCLMIERLLEQTADETDSEFKQILGFLFENHTHVSLDTLAAHFKRSRSHISHLFKTKAGVSLRTYCNDLRLADARVLLQSTDLNVTEVAYEVGFEDASYFIKLFREKYGVSPRKFKA
jgi:AraC-like DNA-binding protein